jgi:O-antigen/teichoic acid export membrane protein
VDSFNRAYAPWLYARLQENDAAQLTRIVRGTYAYFLAVTVGAVLLGTAAPALLGVLVGEQFRAAAPVVLYIALGYAFTGMYYMVANYVFFARRTGGLPLVVGAAAVVNLTVNLWWIPAHGAVGAAQSFALAQAVMFAGTWWLAQRAFPMPWLRARALPSRA